MKILIDINHPAHVHYFKNFIKFMKIRKHKFLIISRNKEIEHYLLEKYNIEYVDRGRGGEGQLGKIFYFFIAIMFIFKKVIIFKPDVLISFGTPYPAIVGWLVKKPHISFNDTEHATIHHLLTDPFSEIIITPSCYNKDMGEKHIYFNGYMEMCYLHPNYYKPDSSILELLNLKRDEKYIIIRFVSWNAVHDRGHQGLDLREKEELVKNISNQAKVFISSESELPDSLKKYQISIPAERMHDALAFATLLISEGATMASECAILGTPAIYINSLEVGYCTEEEQKYNLVFNFRNSLGVLNKAIELVNTKDLSSKFRNHHKRLLIDKIDVTAFMVWCIENYPDTVKIMNEKPEYQNRFR